MHICIYAFSTTALFFRGLIDACAAAGDDVQWSVICPQGNFVHVFDGVIPPEGICYLYKDFNADYAACDEAQIEDAMACGDGLVPSLMRDKSGYRWLDKQEQLRRGAVVHHTYRKFLERMKPDFVMCPNIEATDGFVVMNLCRAMRIDILYAASMRFVGRTCFAADPHETMPAYFGAYTDEDIAEARVVLERFHHRAISYQAGVGYRPSAPPKPSLLRRSVVGQYVRWTKERLHVDEITLSQRIQRNMRKQTAKIRGKLFELTARRYFDEVPLEALPEKFIYFALHKTPESSINGLAPYYVDQLRVIDALLLNLPAGYRLAVKEHPSMYGARPFAFYRELRRRPGLFLLHPSLDSRAVLKKCVLVATVTGTIALEAFIFGKPCLAFGRFIYSHLTRMAPGVLELRATLAEMIAAHRPASEHDVEVEIAKMINVGGNFIADDAWLEPQTMAPGNIAAARAELWRHLGRLADMKAGEPASKKTVARVR